MEIRIDDVLVEINPGVDIYVEVDGDGETVLWDNLPEDKQIMFLKYHNNIVAKVEELKRSGLYLN